MGSRCAQAARGDVSKQGRAAHTPQADPITKSTFLVGRHGQELAHRAANAAGVERDKMTCNTQVYEAP